MKKMIFLCMGLFTATVLFPQSPAAFNYQAVVRSATGTVIANQNVSFRISIQQGTVTGTIVYSERHYTTTNDFGLVTLEIGKGTVDTGAIGEINWGADEHFIKIEIDPAGGESFVFLGSSQLLSVPYALHAKTVKTGDQWGNQVAITDLTLSGDGTSLSPLKIAGQGASPGQTLKWNGVSFAPANDSLGGLTLPYSKDVSTTGAAFRISNSGGTGIWGIATSALGEGINGQAQHVGVFGTSLNETGEGVGTYGQSFSTDGSGVFGFAGATTGYNKGVRGVTVSTRGSGVYGESHYIGVEGLCNITEGVGYGIYGKTLSPHGFSGYFDGGRFYINGITGIGTDPLSGSGMLQILGGSQSAINARNISNESTLYLRNGGSGSAATLMTENGQGLTVSNNSPDYYTTYLSNSGNGPGLGVNVADDFAIFGTSNSSEKATLYLWNMGSGPAADLRSKIKIADGTEGLGKVLTSNETGIASWQTPVPCPWLTNGSAIYYNNGKVGIGTSAPNQLLTLNGGRGFAYLNLVNDATGQTNTDGLLIGITGVFKTAAINNLEDASLMFGTNNLARMTITNTGLIGIGTETPTAQLHVQYNSSVSNPHLQITETEADYSRIMFKNTTAPTKDWTIACRADATDANSRLNFFYSNGLMIGSDIFSITGSGEVQHMQTGDAHVLPIAFGCIRADARIYSGTGNFTCSWSSTYRRYEIAITNENYLFSSYSTIVTPVGDDPHIATATSASNKLLIFIFDLAGNKVQSDFQFVTHQE